MVVVIGNCTTTMVVSIIVERVEGADGTKAHVVGYDVDHDIHPFVVRGSDQRGEVGGGTIVCVDSVDILRPISMVPTIRVFFFTKVSAITGLLLHIGRIRGWTHWKR